MPAAADMPGRPLTELFPEIARVAPPAVRVETYGSRTVFGPATAEVDDVAEERMMELMRSLGYID
jgi:hypothetical protein